MAVEDLELSHDDNGLEFLLFRKNPTKTRQGGLHIKRRQQLQKMFATGDDRCPVAFLSRRPVEVKSRKPFYLAPIQNPQTSFGSSAKTLERMQLTK